MNYRTFKRYVDAIVAASLPAVREVAIVPADPAAPLAPVVDVVLVPKSKSSYVNVDSGDGSACSSNCGYCGRCSDGARGNALCADCGETYDKGDFDSDAFCDDCRAKRDAWATATELRFAKAALPVDVKKGREVA